MVDDEDFEYINQFRWNAYKKKNDTYYSSRYVGTINSKQVYVHMHCDIMGGKLIDHIDGNGLNNQRSNLRFCTKSQNSMNAKPYRNKTSKYKGVSRAPGRTSFALAVNGMYIGSFRSEIEAAKAYDIKAKELFGQFARLNFP